MSWWRRQKSRASWTKQADFSINNKIPRDCQYSRDFISSPFCPTASLFPLPCPPYHHGPPLEGPDWDSAPRYPGLFTELFWHELQEDEMPIRPPSIFDTAKSTALAFTDIHSFEISSLQHLSSFKHDLLGHEIITGRATPLCLSSHLPAQAAYQQPCLCP